MGFKGLQTPLPQGKVLLESTHTHLPMKIHRNGDVQLPHLIPPPLQTFGSWTVAVLSYKTDPTATGLPTSSTPMDAPIYAQGYLDQRKELQTTRPAAPPEEQSIAYHWDYHQGRLMPWKGAGNDPHLSTAFQLGLADQRALNPKGSKQQDRHG